MYATSDARARVQALASADHRSHRVDVGRVGGDDQARRQRVSRDVGHVHQRAGGSLRAHRRRREGSRARPEDGAADRSARLPVPGRRVCRRHAGARRDVSAHSSDPRLRPADAAHGRRPGEQHGAPHVGAAPARVGAGRSGRSEGRGLGPDLQARHRHAAPVRRRSSCAAGSSSQGAVGARARSGGAGAAGRPRRDASRRSARCRCRSACARRGDRLADLPRGRCRSARGRCASDCSCSTPTGFWARSWATMPGFVSSPWDSRRHEPAARGSQRRHHRRQPGPGPGDCRRLRRGRRQRADVRARRDPARRRPRGRSPRWPVPARSVEAERADVSNPADVARAGRESAADLSAGARPREQRRRLRSDGSDRDVDWEAWVRAIEINVYGSVLPCRAVLPHFKQHRYGKIVQLSGGGATNPLPRISAYAASKAAIVRFAESLALEVRPFGIDVNAIAPGALNTRMLDEVLAAGPEAVGREFYDRMVSDERAGRHAARARGRAGRVSRIGRERRHHRPAAQRGVGSVGGARRSSRRSRGQRRLHAAPNRPEGPRVDVGGPMNRPLGVAIVGCGLIGRKRAAALAGARLVACADAVPSARKRSGAARRPERSHWIAGKTRSIGPTSTSSSSRRPTTALTPIAHRRGRSRQARARREAGRAHGRRARSR